MSSAEDRFHAPFDDEASSEAFGLSFTKMLNTIREQKTATMIRKENMQFFYHGEGWEYPSKEDVPASNFQEHSVELVTKFKDIIENDLALIEKALRFFSDRFEVQFYKSLFGTISDTCERVGNTVDAKQYESPAHAFLEMLKKIEFSADKDGKISLPQIHSAPETAERLMRSFDTASDVLKREIEEIKASKIEAAIAKEADRKKRFVNYDAGSTDLDLDRMRFLRSSESA